MVFDQPISRSILLMHVNFYLKKMLLDMDNFVLFYWDIVLSDKNIICYTGFILKLSLVTDIRSVFQFFRTVDISSKDYNTVLIVLQGPSS